MKLSIIIPAYNEARTIAMLLSSVIALDIAPAAKEIIVVDDGSTDGTPQILAGMSGITVITHPRNRGKGAAVRSGLGAADGDYVVIQDADLEYDPRDLARMLEVAQRGNLPAVYGSRRLPYEGAGPRRGSWQYYLGGLGITWFANLLYGTHLTDEPTCYKMIRSDVLSHIPLYAEGFEFCPELTAKIIRLGFSITEIPVRFDARSNEEGKKIRAWDGVVAILTLARYRFWRPGKSPLAWSTVFLGAILLCALFVRLGAVPYGLPLHVVGDEETNIYSALEMLQLHTLLPVLHPNDFMILYEPPLLAYVYAALFIPTLAIAYVLHGMHGLHAFIALVTLDPSLLWCVARTFVVLCSIGTIAAVYKLGRILFNDSMPALLGAFFFATSFLTTAIASAARIWTPGVLLSVLALLFLCQAFMRTDNAEKKVEKPRRKFLIATGAALGLSFGFSYLTWYIPLVGALIVYFSYIRRGNIAGNIREGARAICMNGLIVAVPFLLCAGLFIAVDPHPLYAHTVTYAPPASGRSLALFFGYYGRVLWDFETPLLIASVLGVIMLFARKRLLPLLALALFLISAAVPMYFQLFLIARYLVPLIPVLALLCGYGLWQLSVLIGPRYGKNLLAAAVVVLLVYAGLVYGRYELLLWRGDTRIQAQQWIDTTMPAGSTVIINSGALHLSGTSSSLALQNEIASTSLRAGDRILLADDHYATHPFALFVLDTITATSTRDLLIQKALSQSTGPVYFIEDSWTPPVDTLLPRKTLEKEFIGTEMAQNGLFTDSDASSASAHVLRLLYGSTSLGPDVSVYVLD